jgi:hypothetical protein
VSADQSVYLTAMATRQERSRRLGVEESYQFLRWVDRKVEACKMTKQRGEGGQSIYAPPEDAVVRVLAHNETETTNSRLHFYEVFTGLLKHEGHIVKGVRRLASAGPEAQEERPSSYLKERLLKAPDISIEEAKRLQLLINRKADGAGDFAKLERFNFLRFYKLRSLDGAFLDVYGGRHLDSLTFLLQVVDPTYRFPQDEIGRAKSQPLMAKLAREVLLALGLDHPLDHEHVTEVLGTLRPKLVETKYFRDYGRCVRLFNERAGLPLDLDNQNAVSHALNHIFNRMGLHLLHHKLGRQPTADKVTKRREFLYGGWQVEYESTSRRGASLGVRHMIQLLKLQVRASPLLMRSLDSSLRRVVESVLFRYRHLVEAPCKLAV